MNTDIRNLSKWLNEEQEAPIDRQALARVLVMAEQPAQQEQLREENERLHVENRRLIDRIETIGVSVGVGGIATTTAQRTWVGLTDEDMAEPRTHIFDFIYGARWAEAKLREKNA